MNIIKLYDINPYRVSVTKYSNVEASSDGSMIKPIAISSPQLKTKIIINLPTIPSVFFQLSLNDENIGLSFKIASKSANAYLDAMYNPGMINANVPNIIARQYRNCTTNNLRNSRQETVSSFLYLAALKAMNLIKRTIKYGLDSED
ncbi:hypothetical protein AB4393_22750 [Vibrio splendidus]|uniref:hypothetical protein n=1 Tax=Vibrio splendidus TaxID=29497 RepID=UPI0010566434|nr:hypothetical protein [Vibrio splendidus]